MSEYLKIAAPETAEVEPFRFELAGKKFELPALTENTAPLELLPILLLAMNDAVSQEELVRSGVMFLEYVKADHPDLWRHLKRQPNALEWINGLMESWIAHGGVDPKASSSSS